MALSNYERQKKWREKNRARYNLQRRNHRKNLSGGELGEGKPTGTSNHPSDEGQVSSPAQTSPKSKIEELRELVKMEQEKTHLWHPGAVGEPNPVRKPIIYKSETGMVITKEQWEEREAEKNKARSEGFEIDEYAQT